MKNMWYNYEAVLQAIYTSVPPFDDDVPLERICKQVRFICACTSVSKLYAAVFLLRCTNWFIYLEKNVYVNLIWCLTRRLNSMKS